MPKPMIRRVYRSITSNFQYVRSPADSHRNRSRLHKLSFMLPKKVSHEGPSEVGDGWQCRAKIRRTTSLLIEVSKARLICSAIRGHLHVGLRFFIDNCPDQIRRWTLWSGLG